MKKHVVAILLTFLIVFLPVSFADALNLIYDNNGNLVTGDGFYREYNSLNQLSRIRLLNSTGTILENYIYDPVEEKVLLKNVSYTNGTWKETVYYWFDEYIEVVNASGTFNFTYVEHNGQRVAELQGNTKLFVLSDHLGSSSVITNASGFPLENTSYMPYGGIISGGTMSRYDYEGQEYDSLVKSYDFHFRQYLPDIQIFGQPDTLISNVYDPQKLNRYMFERANPWKYKDPTGHIGITVGAGYGMGFIFEGGSSSAAIGISWTPEEGFQSGWVSNEASANGGIDRGFALGEASANIPTVTIVYGNLKDLEKSKWAAGFGLSLGHGGQIEWSTTSFSISYSPGIGFDIHNYAKVDTTVNLFGNQASNQANAAKNTGTNSGSGRSSSGGSTVTQADKNRASKQLAAAQKSGLQVSAGFAKLASSYGIKVSTSNNKK